MSAMRSKNNSGVMVLINSILLAVFVDIPCINQYLITIWFNIGSVMTMLYTVIPALILLFGLLTKKEHKIKVTPFYYLVVIYVLLLYYLTITDKTGKEPFTQLNSFLVCTVFAFVIPLFSSVKSEIVIKATMLLPIPVVFRLEQVFLQNMINETTMTMGQSYAFLTPIIASIVYLFYFFKQDNVIGKIVGILGCSANLVFLLRLLMYGSRGPVLSIILLILFLYIVKIPSQEENGIKIIKKRLLLGIFTSVIIYVILSSFLLPSLNRIGESFNFINKTLTLADEGDVSNGRYEIFPVIVNGFMDNPIFGHGFDLFYLVGLYYYPHNFLYQTIYDGGLLMFLIVIVPVVVLGYRQLKTQNRESIILLVLLFFISVPGATFSGDLWQQSNLWLLAGTVLCNNRISSISC